MTTTTVDVRIIPLGNSTECIRMIESTLSGIGGVRLLYVDHQNAKFTIETTIHPEQLQDALQHKFAGKSVLLSTRINHSNPFSESVQGPLNFHKMAEALMKVSGGKSLQNVECTQSSTMKCNLNDQPTTSGSATNVRGSQDGGYGYVNAHPPPPPPPPQYERTSSGPPWAYKNVGGYNEDGGYGYINAQLLPPPQPPQQYERTSSGSAWAYESFGGYNKDYGYGYGSPMPSAPPMPKAEAEAETEGYVYGYPVENYMEDDNLRGCCAILLCLFYAFLILFLVVNI